MHVPDGFFDATVSVGAAAVAAGGVALCLRKARDELDERTAPLAGAVAAFIFAVQMINFPIGLGTSGHLMGGALAAILVGPYAGALCVTVVLVVQGLVFADGGLTALGINVVLMAFATAFVGWLVFRLAMSLLPQYPGQRDDGGVPGRARVRPGRGARVRRDVRDRRQRRPLDRRARGGDDRRSTC